MIELGHSGSAQATSSFDVFFELAAPQSFSYERSGSDNSTFASAVVELKKFDGLTYAALFSDNGNFSLTDNGVLAAGAYELSAEAFSGDSNAAPNMAYDSSGAAGYEVSFSVAPLPEPGSLTLAGIAAACGLLVLRRAPAARVGGPLARPVAAAKTKQAGPDRSRRVPPEAREDRRPAVPVCLAARSDIRRATPGR